MAGEVVGGGGVSSLTMTSRVLPINFLDFAIGSALVGAFAFACSHRWVGMIGPSAAVFGSGEDDTEPLPAWSEMIGKTRWMSSEGGEGRTA